MAGAGREERCWERNGIELERLNWNGRDWARGRKGRLGRNIKWENEMFKLAG